MSGEVLLDHQQFVRIGVQSAFKTANAFSGGDKNAADSNATRWFYMVIAKDGFKGHSNRQKTPLDTEHSFRGAALFSRGARAVDGSLSFPLHPATAKLMLDFALAVDTSERVVPHTIQRWMNNAALAGTGKGNQLTDCIGRSFALSLNRQGPQPIILSMPFKFRKDTQLTGTVPTFELPTIESVFDAQNSIIDLVAAGSAFAGAHADIIACDLNIDQGTDVTDFRGDISDGAADGSWNTYFCANPTVGVKLTMRFTTDDYHHYMRGLVEQDFAMRIGMWHPQSNYGSASTTTTTAMTAGLTPGGTSSVTVGSTTGLAVNDVIMLMSADATKFNVVKITSLTATTISFLNDDVLQTTSGTLYIRNCGIGFYVPRLELQSVGDIVSQNGMKVFEMNLGARLVASSTAPIYSYLANNDDAA